MGLKAFITDLATGFTAAVKDSFTAAQPEDRALVVTMSPNQAPIVVTTEAADPRTSVGLITGLVVLGGGTAGTLNEIRATVYNAPTVNGQRSFVSNNAGDTAAGLGAQQLTLIYFDQTGAGPFSEIITLNGLTPVNTINANICFIERITVSRTGTIPHGTNLGTITMYTGPGGTGTVIGTIGIGNLVTAVGDGVTLWAHHYVPIGKVATLATFVAGMSTGTGASTGTMFLRAGKIGVIGSVEETISDLIPVATGIATVRTLGVPIRVIGPAHIEAYVVPSGNNTTSDASFDFSESAL